MHSAHCIVVVVVVGRGRERRGAKRPGNVGEWIMSWQRGGKKKKEEKR